jgi:ABC-2 type transport system permease protein
MTTAVADRRSGFSRLTAVETKLFLRERVGPFWGFAFPVVLLAILGALGGTKVDKQLGTTLTATYVPIVIAFSIAMLALNAMPPVLGTYREKGILRRLSTTPVPPSRLLAAQVSINAATAAASTVLVLVVARLAFNVALPRQVGGFLLAWLLAAAGLFGIGLTIAAMAASGRAANAVGAICFFPLMFFAGLWVPRAVMPAALRDISDYTPLGAAVGALQRSAAGLWPHPVHLIVLAAYAVLFSALAVRYFRWE